MQSNAFVKEEEEEKGVESKVIFVETLEELKEVDRFGTFDGYMTVEKAKQDNIIVDELKSYVPDKCKCGAENIVTKSLTQLQCCNPRCWIKVAGNLEHFYKRNGIEGVGPATCQKLVKEVLSDLRYKSHLDVINLTQRDIPYSISGGNMYDLLNANQRIKQSPSLPFSRMVASLGIPGWEANAIKYLSEYDTLKDILNLVRQKGWYAFFAQDLLIQDTKLMWQFYVHVWDIVSAIQNIYPNTIPRAFSSIDITLSGTLYPRKRKTTKEAYMRLINDMTPIVNGRKLYSFNSNKALQSNKYIVSDEFHRSAQVAKEREKSTGEKVLYTSTEFLDFLEKHFDDIIRDVEANNKKLEETQE